VDQHKAKESCSSQFILTPAQTTHHSTVLRNRHALTAAYRRRARWEPAEGSAAELQAVTSLVIRHTFANKFCLVQMAGMTKTASTPAVAKMSLQGVPCCCS